MKKQLIQILTLSLGLGLGAMAYAHGGEKHGAEAPAAEGSAEPTEVKNSVDAANDEKARAYFTDLDLVNQDGETVKFYSDVLKDQIVIINFIFTNCDGACPLATQKLTAVRHLLGDKVGKPLRFISISLDPERDSPAALREFASKYKADTDDWIFLTGNVDNVTQVIKRLGQFTDSLESHSTLMLVGDVKTAHWLKIPPQALPMTISEKLRMLIDERNRI